MPALQVKDFPTISTKNCANALPRNAAAYPSRPSMDCENSLRMHKAYQSVRERLWAAPYVTDLLEKEEEQKRLERVRKRHTSSRTNSRTRSGEYPR